MRLLVRGDSDALRSSFSFSSSGMIHGALLALVVFGKTAPGPERPRSLYDQAIRPQEKQIVWYHAPDRLPDIRPAALSRADSRPLRATRKAEQRIVAGPSDDSQMPRLVWAPPAIELPPMTPLPNVLALEKPTRAFTPPPVKAPVLPTPTLPDAEAVALGAAAPAGANLAPLKKTFTPPPATAARLTVPALPDAEAVAGVGGAAPAGPDLKPLKKTFTPPPVAAARLTVPVLPDAEAVAGVGGAAPAGPNLTPLKKAFRPPPLRSVATVISLLPDAEAVPTVRGAAPAGPSLMAPPAPDLPAVSTAHLAIVGLDPSKLPILPAAPPPRTAGFSAGTKRRPDGASTDGDAAGVVVPGVTVRDGPSRNSLLAAIRPMAPPAPAAPPTPAGPPPSTRVTGAPDPSLQGRTVYSIAIQMPNITSYSGSWLVWFAERQAPAAGTMRAPSPLRKVDPKYVAAAAAEGVQGIVRLGATIRKDGQVENVQVLRRLDDRLDRSAVEALAKWQFEPATRGGAPVDVDAVFEIPFRLAPKPLK
jgi:TonB family protein